MIKLIVKMAGYLWAKLFTRECCFDCQYTNLDRPSDFTIGDFWDFEEKRPDMHFLGDDKGIFNPKESIKTSEEMFHPGGGCSSSLSYKMQKYIDKMEPGTKPNIIGSGHFHQSHMMAYRNVIAFLIPCLTAKTNFAIRQGLENTMGAYFIDMYVNKDGDIEMIEFEEKRYTEKDIKKDDYMKTKQLVLKREN